MSYRKAITLRRLSLEDAESLARLANNKKIWACVRDQFPHPYTEENARDFICSREDESPALTFTITDSSDKFCGVISLVPQEDVYRNSAEIGYWIGEPFWGKGIATKAIALMTRYGFDELDLERIYAAVFDFNQASMKALENNGYRKEGVLRNAAIKNGQLHDEHRYARLRGD